LFRFGTKLFQKSFVPLLLDVDFLYALFAQNKSFGRGENLSLYYKRSLPALQSLCISRKACCFGPHSMDVLKVVLKVPDHLLLHRFIIFFKVFYLLLKLWNYIFRVLLRLLLHCFELLFAKKKLFNRL